MRSSKHDSPKALQATALTLHPAGACNVGAMHSLMFHRYQKLLLVCGSEGVLVWCFAGYRKVPKPLASVPKKSVVKLKRDTANKAGSMKKQVLCMQRQCLKSSARLSACYLLLCRSTPLPGTATYASLCSEDIQGTCIPSQMT